MAAHSNNWATVDVQDHPPVPFTGHDDLATASKDFNPDQPRDEQGQWASGGGSSGAATSSGGAHGFPVYHITNQVAANKIFKEGLHVGKAWMGRPPSVYFTGTLEAAREYANLNLPNASATQYAIVEFKKPTDSVPDEHDQGTWNVAPALQAAMLTASRVEHPIDAKDIISIHFFERDMESQEVKETYTVRSGEPNLYDTVPTSKSGSAFAVVVLRPKPVKKFNPNHDDKGQFSAGEGGSGSGPAQHGFPVYHTTNQVAANKIFREGLHPGDAWMGRPPSVYFTDTFEGAQHYAEILPNVSPGQYAIVEFKMPTDAVPDEHDRGALGGRPIPSAFTEGPHPMLDPNWSTPFSNLGLATASRVEHPINPKDIISIHFFETDMEEGERQQTRVVREVGVVRPGEVNIFDPEAFTDAAFPVAKAGSAFAVVVLRPKPVKKFDPNHDDKGQFSAGDGGSSGGTTPGGAKAALKAIDAKLPLNPIDSHENLFISEDKIAVLELAEHGGRLRIKGIRSGSPGERSGVASAALDHVLSIADKHGVTVELTASTFDIGKPGTLDGDQLREWYSRHGFVMEPGYDESLGYMIHEPKVSKFNEVHDELGRFASSDGGSSADGSPGHEYSGVYERGAVSPEKSPPKVSWGSAPSAQAFIAARNQSEHGGFLSPLTVDELAGSELHLSEDGKVGYAISSEGDFGNLFNNDGPKGAGQTAILQAIESGKVKTADCFNGYLPELYVNYGLTAVSAMRFNDEYAPPNWNYAEDDRPDVLFLAYTGGATSTLKERVGSFGSFKHPKNWTNDYDAGKTESRRRALVAGVSSKSAGSLQLRLQKSNLQHDRGPRFRVGQEPRWPAEKPSQVRSLPLISKDNHWIGVDLDGTLAMHVPSDQFDRLAVGAPIPLMVNRVKRMLAEGKDVRIFTARITGDKSGEVKRVINTWVKEHLGQSLPITNIKDHHMLRLYDDRAVGVERNTGVLKGNDCHNPEGAGGGQFCSGDGGSGGGSGSGGGIAMLDRLPASRMVQDTPAKIPDGTIHLYHYTGGEGLEDTRNNLASIVEHGIRQDRAKGSSYGEPSTVWGSTAKPRDFKEYVEFWVKPEDIGLGKPQASVYGQPLSQKDIDEFNAGNHDVTVNGNVSPDQIVGIHEDWHTSYQYVEQEPSLQKEIKEGKIDYMLDPTSRYYDGKDSIGLRRWIKDNPEFAPKVSKYNPNHDDKGQFSAGDGGGASPHASNPRVFNSRADVESKKDWGKTYWQWKDKPGRLLTGEPLDKVSLPAELYHVTTAAPAVQASGVLLGQAANAGLGGGQADGVSFTTSRDAADLIQRELTRNIQIVRGETGIKDIARYAKEDEATGKLKSGALDRAVGAAELNFSVNHSMKDAFNSYLTARETDTYGNTALQNPVLFGNDKALADLDPSHVRVLAVPSKNIPDGALITTGSDKFLHEVRAYSDVPVAGIKVIKRGVEGATIDDGDHWVTINGQSVLIGADGEAKTGNPKLLEALRGNKASKDPGAGKHAGVYHKGERTSLKAGDAHDKLIQQMGFKNAEHFSEKKGVSYTYDHFKGLKLTLAPQGAKNALELLHSLKNKPWFDHAFKLGMPTPIRISVGSKDKKFSSHDSLKEAKDYLHSLKVEKIYAESDDLLMEIEKLNESWITKDNDCHNPSGDGGGQFCSSEGGGAGGSSASALGLSPAVAEVGGDKWNRETAVRLEKEYQSAKPGIEKTAQSLVGAEGMSFMGEEEADPTNWDEVTESDKQEAESKYVNDSDHINSEVESQMESWKDPENYKDPLSSSAAQHFAEEIVGTRDWQTNALADMETDSKIPVTLESLQDAVSIDEKGEVGWDDSKLVLSNPPDPNQQDFPFAAEFAAESLISDGLRNEIDEYLQEQFVNEVTERVDNADTPDWMYEQASESLADDWNNNMDDEQKFSFADHNITFEKITSEVERFSNVDIPSKWEVFDSNKPGYDETRAFARVLSVERAEEILAERGITDITRDEVIALDNRVWESWKSSSKSTEGQALQLAIAQELGGRTSTHLSSDPDAIISKNVHVQKYTKGNPEKWNVLKAYARAKWETTQYVLDKSGMDTVGVYRAIGMDDPSFKDKTSGTKLDVQIQRNGAASATTDPSVANQWGSGAGASRVVLRAELPRTAILSVPVYGQNVHNEKETVIVGTAWKKWDAWLGHAPTFAAVPLT